MADVAVRDDKIGEVADDWIEQYVLLVEVVNDGLLGPAVFRRHERRGGCLRRRSDQRGQQCERKSDSVNDAFRVEIVIPGPLFKYSTWGQNLPFSPGARSCRADFGRPRGA